MPVVTTLALCGQTETALRHYQEALGAEVVFMMRFRDSPDQSHTRPGMEDLIFHATFRVLDTVIAASDVGYVAPSSTPKFEGFALLLQMDSLASAKHAFASLAENGEVLIPLAESKFTSWYGIVIDRFGVNWKINVDTSGH